MYYANTLPIFVALKLQQLMTYGSFQTPARPNSNQFITPFQSLHDLDLNTPLLPAFPFIFHTDILIAPSLPTSPRLEN